MIRDIIYDVVLAVVFTLLLDWTSSEESTDVVWIQQNVNETRGTNDK